MPAGAISLGFLLWLCIAAACDIIYRKCYNWIVILGILTAFISIAFMPESHPVAISLKDSFIGAISGFCCLLISYLFKVMGAGDVKFAAALGAWIGWQLLLPIWVLSCGFAVLHGFFEKNNLIYFFTIGEFEKKAPKNRKFIPYVSYLALATAIVLIFET